MSSFSTSIRRSWTLAMNRWRAKHGTAATAAPSVTWLRYILAIVACVAAQAGMAQTSSTALPLTTQPNVWLNAGAGVTTAGSAVTTWADQSGNSRNATQGTSTARPTLVASSENFAGQAALQFDGNDSLSGTWRASSSRQASVFAVYKLAAGTSGSIQVPLFLGSQTNSAGFGVGWNNGGRFNSFLWGGAEANLSGFRSTTQIHAGTITTGSATLYLSGSTTGTAAGTPNIGAAYAVGNASSPVLLPLANGAQVAEIIVFDTALGAADVRTMGNYLSGKYAVATTTSRLWSGGSSDAGAASNWGGTLNASDQLVFTGTLQTSPVLNSNFSAAGVAFTGLGTSGAFSLGGSGTLSLGGNGVANWTSVSQSIGVALALSGTASWNIVGDVSVSGPISGSGGFTKSGAGTLALTGTNTFSGATSIATGSVSINGANALQGTSDVTIAGGAGLTYTGAAATFAKNITVMPGSGTGTITNTGGGLLTLAGTLSKDNSVLRLSGGSFNVTGLITGATPGTSDLVVDAASVTLANTNTYDGPTYVYNSGTLALGVSNAIPSNSVVTLGGPGTGTLDLGGFTNTIGGLAFSGSGGTVRMAANQTATAQLATGTSLSLGAGTAIDLTGMSTSAGLYRLISYSSQTGTFGTVTGLAGGYQLVYGATELAAQQQAVLGAVTVTSPTAAIITGGSTAFTYTVANAAGSSGMGLSFTGTGISNVTGLTSGSVAAGSTSGATSGLSFTGTAVGFGQNGQFTVNAPTAYGSTTATGTVSVTVLDHATSSLGGTLLTSTTISLGTWNYSSNTWESGTSAALFSIYNIASSFGPGLTADLSLLGVTGTANGFTTNLGSYAKIAGGTSSAYSIFVDPTGFGSSGTQSTTFVLAMSDDTALSGATATNTLSITATVIVVPEPAAVALAGVGLAVAGWSHCRRRRFAGTLVRFSRHSDSGHEEP